MPIPSNRDILHGPELVYARLKCWEEKEETETETERQTEREERKRDRETETERQTEREGRKRETDIDRDRDRDREADRKAETGEDCIIHINTIITHLHCFLEVSIVFIHHSHSDVDFTQTSKIRSKGQDFQES